MGFDLVAAATPSRKRAAFIRSELERESGFQVTVFSSSIYGQENDLASISFVAGFYLLTGAF